MERNDLRQMILTKRDHLSSDEQQYKSRQILDNLTAIKPFSKVSTLFSYVNFRSEAATMDLIYYCLQRPVKVTVPLTLTGEKKLISYLITDPKKDLVPGYCNIPEPLQTLPVIDPKTIDLVILPGSVFDFNGGRLGYGGGYYDRFLQYSAPQALKIGLAFDLQIVDKVPVLAHDQKLDWLITESRAVKI
jgi:5-formyltetrahydrofolate cyclo-ligase